MTVLTTNDTDEFIYKSLDKKLDMYAQKENKFFINIGKKSFRIYSRSVDDYKKLFFLTGFKFVKKYNYKYSTKFLNKVPELKQYPLDVSPYVTLEFVNK